MIIEDYVSFETAKLLKEKGFDEATNRYYNAQYDQIRTVSDTFLWNWNDEEFMKRVSMEGAIAIPTIQMTMKWLREVHNQIIVPGIRTDDRTSGTINCYIVGIWYIPKNNGGAFCYTSPTPYNGYSTYEEACEAAIKYCLENLIETKK